MTPFSVVSVAVKGTPFAGFSTMKVIVSQSWSSLKIGSSGSAGADGVTDGLGGTEAEGVGVGSGDLVGSGVVVGAGELGDGDGLSTTSQFRRGRATTVRSPSCDSEPRSQRAPTVSFSLGIRPEKA
ncbi:hypothetical protein [Micromonospora sp. NBS 11-29]|uniref:hypothetical protein n=1 Tax=Micromonospora sp. NBS 11-29 TaxID=1960879 RepID=UPI00111D18A4|nr:hypothetical protein [Micromonospora sp. NBS 11-29]